MGYSRDTCQMWNEGSTMVEKRYSEETPIGPLTGLQRQILSALFYSREMSRTELTVVCNASLPTISRTVKQMIDSGYLVEKKTGESANGRKPILLGMNENHGFVIAVNFVCTNVEYAIFDFAGTCVFSNTLYIRRRNYFDCLFRAIDDAIGIIEERYGQSPLCISIAGHGFIDEKQGIIEKSVSFGWKEVRLKEIVSQRYGVPTHVISNMQLAAYGEWMVGGYQEKGISNFAVLGIGNGLGSGAILNQTLIKGNGAAGEVGLTWVGYCDGDRTLYTLEELAAGQRMISLVKRYWDDADNVYLRELTNNDPNDVLDEDVIEAIIANDGFARRLFKSLIPFIGMAVAQLARMYDPSVIVIYDIYSRLDAILLDQLNAWLAEHSKYHDFDQIEIKISQLKHNACIHGAAYAAYARMFGVENETPI